jgi:hypothetical protein
VISGARRLATAWVVVVVFTLIYLIIDRTVDDDGALGASTLASIAAISLALIKVRIIMREFMDVRHAPRILRTMTDVLVVVMAASLVGTYLVGRTVA